MKKSQNSKEFRLQLKLEGSEPKMKRFKKDLDQV